MPVILFDIDGTLIRSGGAGKLAMARGLKSAFGLTEINDNVPYAGRTDRGIGFDLLRAHRLDETEANLQALQAAYLDALPASLVELGGSICVGIPAILEELTKRDNVQLGLLTGNTLAGARIKLRHFGLWHHFACGGYGDDHHERDDVARSAVAAMKRHVKREIERNELWVIGDTPLDIQCGRAVGATVVAVATGWHAIDELSHADHVFSDLADANGFLTLIGS